MAPGPKRTLLGPGKDQVSQVSAGVPVHIQTMSVFFFLYIHASFVHPQNNVQGSTDLN